MKFVAKFALIIAPFYYGDSSIMMHYENWGGERTGWITNDSLLALAVSLDLDIAEFSSCLDSKSHIDRVRESTRYGKSIDISSTPTFLISNGEDVIKIRGAQPIASFVRAIESL